MLLYIQIAVSILLLGLILLQAKGVGLGRSFSSVSYHSKRGVEKVVFRLTVLTAIAFVVISALNVV